MREIKFRVWTGFMMEYNVMAGYLGSFYVPGIDPKDTASMSPMNTIYEDLPLMQYTGLKDKNGKDIYQGDIVKIGRNKKGYGHTSYGGYAEIISETCGYSFRLFSPTLKEIEHNPMIDEDGDLIVWDSSSLWHLSDEGNIEIIGNIYQDPELLVNNGCDKEAFVSLDTEQSEEL